MEQLYVGVDVHFLSYPMPRKLGGLFRKHKGNYYIVVNCNLSIEEQKKVLKHEVHHLVERDLECEDEVYEIERRNV